MGLSNNGHCKTVSNSSAFRRSFFKKTSRSYPSFAVQSPVIKKPSTHHQWFSISNHKTINKCLVSTKNDKKRHITIICNFLVYLPIFTLLKKLFSKGRATRSPKNNTWDVHTQRSMGSEAQWMCKVATKAYPRRCTVSRGKSTPAESRTLLRNRRTSTSMRR